MPPVDTTLTPEQHGDWFTPSRAIEIMDAVYSDSTLSKETMLEHLRGGMVQAVAENTAVDGVRSGRARFVPIPSKDWSQINTYDSIWKTGHLTSMSIRPFDPKARYAISMCDLSRRAFEPSSTV